MDSLALGGSYLMVANWIFLENLRPFLESLAWFSGYTFGPDEWIAIRDGIQDTDEEHGHWFEYEYAGEMQAKLRLALDQGTSVIHLRIEVPLDVVPKVEAALSIFQRFRVQTDA
jgi:hypothetical protein